MICYKNFAVIFGTVVITSGPGAVRGKPQTFHNSNPLYEGVESQEGPFHYRDMDQGEDFGSGGHDPGGYYSHSNDNRLDFFCGPAPNHQNYIS